MGLEIGIRATLELGPELRRPAALVTPFQAGPALLEQSRRYMGPLSQDAGARKTGSG
jgi:hypothetical protein